jgi:hypothetical protein
MFHGTRESLKIGYRRRYWQTLLVALCLSVALGMTVNASDPPEYLASFDPSKGFKPAQRDLTEIFLQIAGSLEYYGNPVPYMQHMAQEHQRIEALYQARYGATPTSYRPAYMTDDYLNRFAANWNFLSPKLGLDSYTKDVGHAMRDGIKGTRGTGTILVNILNQHQSHVFDRMAGKDAGPADFKTLQSEIITQLDLDKPDVDEESFEIGRRDAISFAFGIQGETMKLFKKIDETVAPKDAKQIKAAISGVYIDVGRMAESELEAGIAEWALQKQSAAAN